jgi:hypothetical protein
MRRREDHQQCHLYPDILENFHKGGNTTGRESVLDRG